MKFSIGTKVFRAGVEVVSHASVSTSMTPILENILINVQYKRIVLTANNLEMAIEYVIDTDIDVMSEGSFTVSAKFLTSFLSLVSDDRLQIELIGSHSLEFVTPSSETKVKGIDPAKFPLIPAFKANQPFRMPVLDTKNAIEKTIFSTAQGSIRPTLAGIHVSVNPKGIAFASTDSFRLSEQALELENADHAQLSMIVPSKTAMELSRILPEEGMVEFFVHDNQLLVVTDKIRLFSRLLNGHFPDYRNFFPKGYSTKGVILRNDLIMGLKRMNLISRENNFNTRLAFLSDHGGSNARIEISTGDTEIGAGTIRIPSSVEGEDSTVGINSAYLLEVLNVIKDDYVSIDFETNLSPVLVRGVPEKNGKAAFRHIIMPLKI